MFYIKLSDQYKNCIKMQKKLSLYLKELISGYEPDLLLCTKCSCLAGAALHQKGPRQLRSASPPSHSSLLSPP